MSIVIEPIIGRLHKHIGRLAEIARDADARAQRAEAALRDAQKYVDMHGSGLELSYHISEVLATPPPEGGSESWAGTWDEQADVPLCDWKPGMRNTPEQADSYPLDSEGRCLKCGGTGRIGVDSTREPCPACTSLPSQQAHGDALAALNRIRQAIECPVQYAEETARDFAIVRRHLTASGVPYVQEDTKRLLRDLRLWMQGDRYRFSDNPSEMESWSTMIGRIDEALASAPAVPELSHKTAMQLVEVFDNYEDERGPGTLGRRAESMQAAWRFVHRAAAPTDGRE